MCAVLLNSLSRTKGTIDFAITLVSFDADGNYQDTGHCVVTSTSDKKINES